MSNSAEASSIDVGSNGVRVQGGAAPRMQKDADSLSGERHFIVPELIARQAKENPAAVAISHGDIRLTYKDLVERSSSISRCLKGLGLTPGTVVAIYSERLPALMVSALGIWRAGGAYLPLDPSYPAERLAYQLQNAGTKILIITEGSDGEQFADQVDHLLLCSRDGRLHAQVSSDDTQVQISGDALAYVIYTSGSTGRPKGVEITHGNLLNFMDWFVKEYELTSEDQVSNVCAVGFDLAVSEIWPPLTVGATLHIADKSVMTSVESLREWILQKKITATWLPTPMAEKLLALEWPEPCPVRLMVTIGDTLHMYPRPGLPFRFANGYGPTECTVFATSVYLPAKEKYDGLPPIGWPVTNLQLYVVDENLQRVPDGIEGEILIGGKGVGRGYRNRPDLTAEKFIPNTFEPEKGPRLYRTGDRGVVLPDGQLAFRGRIDNQIKVLGVRMEPGEIEGALNEHPSVRQSVVVAREYGAGDKRLVAYLSLQPNGSADLRELRTFLTSRLPAPMIPSLFVVLDELPLSTNGKIDRRALPAPKDGNTLSVGVGTPPRNELEKRLQQIWEELLEIPSIGVEQDFFELGGDSLMATQLLVNLERDLSFKLPLSALLEARTIEDLARVIRRPEGSAGWSSLVAVQPLGSRPPLFCVHSGRGDVMYCEYIARGAGPDQPIYGLQSRALTGNTPHTTVEQMSDYYLKEIRRVQSHGPYYLFGFCFGGMVAHDIARRLNAEGEEVAYLGMYDAPAPGTFKGNWQLYYVAKRAHHELLKLHRMGIREKSRHLARNVKNFALLLVRIARLEAWRALSHGRPGSPTAGLQNKIVNLEDLNDTAERNFASAYVYPGCITLYLSPEIRDVYSTPPDEGWKSFAAMGISVIPILNGNDWQGPAFVETVGGSLRQFIPSPMTPS